jgi:hypothetical protein
VTGLIRIRRISDTTISLEKKLHTLKEGSSEEYEEEGKAICMKFIFSNMKQNLGSIISFMDTNPKYNKYYQMLREVSQDVVKEQYKRRTQTKTNSF